MTSKLTREQLHERARENVKALKMASRQTAFESAREEILADLQLAELALAAMDGEPVAEVLSNRPGNDTSTIDRALPVGTQLYRHAQPVVPQDVLEALQKVARIRLDMNDFDGDRRGIADCLCDAEEALIEVVNRRAAMLAAADCSIPMISDRWIPVSEQMPDENAEQQVLACFKGGDISTLYYFEGRWDDAYGIVPIRQDVTHWMPLPAAPQEGK
ncbi:TPA: DUF551 domain-containing protein [Klebsiella quasipneumoniae subsp. similipneumoniae]|nr:DUF551 domain-containing protein [Klebsiella quasipneumoniae subsp. similipneumoniae]